MNWLAFDDVPNVVAQLVSGKQALFRTFDHINVIRDLWGRIRFVIAGAKPEDKNLTDRLDEFGKEAAAQLSPYAYPAEDIMVFEDDLTLSMEALKESPAIELLEGPPRLCLYDRQIIGLSWADISPDANAMDLPQRIAFYSLKGGVGRSTATAVAGWHLAKRGLSIMVVDLDLEAPGLSASLLPPEHQPDFGIVDWFVEDAVGQGDIVIDRMVGTSPLALDLPGNIAVVPCHGATRGEYIAKLGRCYLDIAAGGEIEAWQYRLSRLLFQLERSVRPDVVLLDTRSGLHDLASAAVTDIAHTVLLFGIDSSQTWQGYGFLFDHWRRFGVADQIRERLQMVAALVPETGREEYLEQFSQESWNLFMDHLYDQLEQGQLEGFSFDLDDEAGPHYPLPIFWNRGFASLASFASLDVELVEAVYSGFLSRLDQMIWARTETL